MDLASEQLREKILYFSHVNMSAELATQVYGHATPNKSDPV